MRILNHSFSLFVKIILGLLMLFLIIGGLAGNIIFFIMIILPLMALLYRTGVEIDFTKKRLRDISGINAMKKDEWQDISTAEYIGMAGSTQTRSSSAIRPSQQIAFQKSNVNLFLEDRHVHLYTGPGKKALAVAEEVAKKLNIEINDNRGDEFRD